MANSQEGKNHKRVAPAHRQAGQKGENGKNKN
jgi:hypothetical protein